MVDIVVLHGYSRNHNCNTLRRFFTRLGLGRGNLMCFGAQMGSPLTFQMELVKKQPAIVQQKSSTKRVRSRKYRPSELNRCKLSLTSLGLERGKTGLIFLFTDMGFDRTGCEAMLIILFLLLFGEEVRKGVLKIHQCLYFINIEEKAPTFRPVLPVSAPSFFA